MAVVKTMLTGVTWRLVGTCGSGIGVVPYRTSGFRKIDDLPAPWQVISKTRCCVVACSSPTEPEVMDDTIQLPIKVSSCDYKVILFKVYIDVHSLQRPYSAFRPLRNYRIKIRSDPIPMAARSKAWVCGRTLAGIAIRNPPATWMSVSCECCVLSVRGLCFRPIPRPEESYWLCVYHWSVIRCNSNPVHLQWVGIEGSG